MSGEMEPNPELVKQVEAEVESLSDTVERHVKRGNGGEAVSRLTQSQQTVLGWRDIVESEKKLVPADLIGEPLTVGVMPGEKKLAQATADEAYLNKVLTWMSDLEKRYRAVLKVPKMG